MEASLKPEQQHTPTIVRGLMAAQPDKTLCALAARGHAGAFEAMHARYHRRIFVYVYQLLGRRATAEDAEDLTQETFQAAFRSLDKRQAEASLKAWLFVIARNRTFDYLRINREPTDELTDEAVASEADTERIVEQKAELIWLLGAFSALPDRQREALALRELGGLSYGEIGNTIDATEPAVKQLLTRARDSISIAAGEAGVRPPRRLQKNLNLLFPVIPAAKGGAAIAATIGIAGGTAAGVTGLTTAKLVGAGLLAAGLIGGSAVGIKQVSDSHAEKAAATVTPPSASSNKTNTQTGAPSQGNRTGAGEDNSSGGDGRHKSGQSDGTDQSGSDGSGDNSGQHGGSSPEDTSGSNGGSGDNSSQEKSGGGDSGSGNSGSGDGGSEQDNPGSGDSGKGGDSGGQDKSGSGGSGSDDPNSSGSSSDFGLVSGGDGG